MVSSWALPLFGLECWFTKKAPVSSQYFIARARAPLVCSAPGVSTTFAPKEFRILNRSSLHRSLMKIRTGNPWAAPTIAMAIAVLPAARLDELGARFDAPLLHRPRR